MNQLDFQGLGVSLLARAREILPTWLPGGKIVGREYTCSDLGGGNGDSFKVNVETGLWADFAGGVKGGDLISLYAAIENVSQGDAFKRLSESTGHISSRPSTPAAPPKPVEDLLKIDCPPADAGEPDMAHPKFGTPSMTWCYRKRDGSPIFHVARYDTGDDKEIVPYSWSTVKSAWVAKGFPAPRPLYGMEFLDAKPDAPVMVVEGEKAADAARKIAGHVYVVVTWPNGSNAHNKADWWPIYGRSILIWPDNDEAGRAAAKAVAKILSPECKTIKIIDVSGQPDKWDAYDALKEGWDWKRLVEWAKPRANPYNAPVAKAEPTPRPLLADSSPAPTVAIAAVNAATMIQSTAPTSVTVTTASEDAPPSSSLMATWEDLGLALTKQGTPIPNADNVIRILERSELYKNLLWYDEFHGKYFTRWKMPPDQKPREWLDIDELNLMVEFQFGLGMTRIEDGTVHKACKVYAQKNKRNEPRDWMNSLQWDGMPRVDVFFASFFGSVMTPYTTAVSKNFWIGMAARIFSPGCQLDNMVVLEGAQGVGKTRALEAIGGDWYAEQTTSVNDKDFLMGLKGKLILEIAELDSFSKGDVTKIKQIITCPVDHYRDPYGRAVHDRPRMSVFVGTTNEDNWQRDQTGGRRFWPIRCGRIEKALILKHREQLFAEAVQRYKAGEKWYQMPKEETATEQEHRRLIDEWENAIREWLPSRLTLGVTIREVAKECLDLDIKHIANMDQRRITSALKNCNWTVKHERGGNRWFPKAASDKPVMADEVETATEPAEAQ